MRIILLFDAHFGVVAAVGAGQKSQKVEAATEETSFYVDVRDSLWGIGNIDNVKIHLWGEGPGDVYIHDAESGLSKATINGVTYVSFSIASHPGVSGVDIYCWDRSSAGNISAWTLFSDFSEGQNLITVGSSGKWDTNQPVTLGTIEVGVMHSITKYGICDGNKAAKWVLDIDSVEDGNTYPVPGRENLDNYHFGGWFIDEDCMVAYVTTEITTDTNLYAKYTTFSKDSYIYYVTGSESATPNSIHTWGGDVEYKNSGTNITGITGVQEVHGVLQFRGTAQLIYKIPVSSESGDTSFKFYFGDWADESPEKTLVGGSAYYWASEDGYDEAAAGDALDFLIEAEAIRNAVRESGGAPADYSVCGISKEDAGTLCTAYNGLSEKARGYVDTTNTHTYNPDAKLDINPEHQTEVTYYRVMEQLADIAKVSLVGHSASRLVPASGTESFNSTVIIVIASTIALITVAGCFLLKRKEK